MDPHDRDATAAEHLRRLPQWMLDAARVDPVVRGFVALVRQEGLSERLLLEMARVLVAQNAQLLEMVTKALAAQPPPIVLIPKGD